MKCNNLYTGRTLRVLRRSAAFAILIFATGCDLPQRQPVVLGYRNPTVPLAATTRFEEDRFVGTWTTVACIGICASRTRYFEVPDGIFSRETDTGVRSYLISPPGVLREMGGRETLVVMWVDEGFRTAAIGDSNGRWAAILNRGKPSADRTQAATEILDFNGWDVSRLQRVGG